MSAGFLFIMLTSCVAAVTPKFALTPTTVTSFKLRPSDTVIVRYRVTNNTNSARALTIVPVAGVTQIIGNADACRRPFVLGKGHSCVLSLRISGAQLTASGIHGGPTVCKTIGRGDSNPDPYLCSQPPSPNILHVNPN